MTATVVGAIRQDLHPALFSLVERQLRVTPKHEKFLTRRFQSTDHRELDVCDGLARQIAQVAGDRLDVLCRDYDFICQIQQEEEYHFRRHDEYRLKSFADALREVYNNKPYMDSYMNGLLMTQIYWSNHTASFTFYRDRYLTSLPDGYKFVEVGPGHGLLLYQAAADPRAGSVSGWDLSEASIEQTRAALARLGAPEVPLVIQNLFDVEALAETYDGVGFSEVLEHMEEPARALGHLRTVLKPGGRLFVNVPINSPAPDHLYLLRSPEEAVAAVENAGFVVDESGFFPVTNYTIERARKWALTISVCMVARRV